MYTNHHRITISVNPENLQIVYLIQPKKNTRKVLATRFTLRGAIEFAEMLERQLDLFQEVNFKQKGVRS